MDYVYSLAVAKGETVVCTFTNTRDQGSVQLKKSWGTGTVGETTLNIGTGTSGAAVSDVATKDLTGANKGNGQTDAKNVDTGTYYFSEVSPGHRLHDELRLHRGRGIRGQGRRIGLRLQLGRGQGRDRGLHLHQHP